MQLDDGKFPVSSPATCSTCRKGAVKAVDMAATAGGGEGGADERSAFRVEEKRYRLYRPDPRQVRQKKQPPAPDTDFTDVVDASDVSRNTAANRAMLHVTDVAADDSTVVRAVTFDGVPGLVIFPGLVAVAAQRRWALASLTEYAMPPHPNNVSRLDPTFVPKDGYEPGMRWTTLGYSYEWSSRTYDRSRLSPFPGDLKELMARVVALLPLVDPRMKPVSDGYEAQTAIVNYYPVGSMMCGHQDLSEVCLQRPLVSLSLGCSCVFLMGTERRDDQPHAFWLRSGDVAVFTGPSRLAYHGVPRILDDVPAWFQEDGHDDASRSSNSARQDEGPSNQYQRAPSLRRGRRARSTFLATLNRGHKLTSPWALP
jgi:alkylated DNA repair protein alkB family protein 1